MKDPTEGIKLKITNSTSYGVSAANSNESPLELKKGETYTATVKEKLSDDEAVVQIRGKETKVKFEGTAPSKGEQVTLQVSEQQSSSTPQVKVVSAPEKGTQSANGSIPAGTTAGSYNQDVADLSKMLAEQGIQVDAEGLQQIRLFWQQTAGTPSEKLDAVQALLNKGLEPTVKQLTAVHEALHGQPLSDQLTRLINRLSAAQTGRTGESNSLSEQAIASSIQKSGVEQLVALLRKQISGEPLTTDERTKLEAGLKSLLSGSFATGQSEALGQFAAQVTEIMSEGKQEKAIAPAVKPVQHSDGTIADTSNVHASDDETVLLDQLEKALSQENGKATERLNQALDEAESWLSSSYAAGSAIDNGAQAAKAFLVTEITKRLSSAADQFRTLKRDVTKQLGHAIEIVNRSPVNPLPQVKPMLESAIDTLDRAILKSDITMLTDMSMEKKLMKASTQLADARKLLANGNSQEAAKVLEQVKSTLEAMNWKPTDTKVKYMLANEASYRKDTGLEHKLPQEAEGLRSAAQQTNHSARDVFEVLRKVGLNYDSELAQALTAGGEEHRAAVRNVKGALMQLASEGNVPTGHPVEQALQSVTGQQLLSKNEASSSTQSAYFQLPLPTGDESNSMKVFIQSRKNGEKMDWENCSLYFLMDTPKMGETGIQISVTDRRLSLTIKNDTPEVKMNAEASTDRCMERLKEIGYMISAIKVTSLKDADSKSAAASAAMKGERPSQSTAAPNSAPAKGFDFKI